MILPWKDERHITHRSFRIIDLLEGEGDLIRGRTFEDCTIYGPAVVVPLNHVSFEHDTFEGDRNAILWEIPDEKERVIGAIGLVDCTFRRCIFRGVGFAGKRPLIEQFLGEVGGSPPPNQPAPDGE